MSRPPGTLAPSAASLPLASLSDYISLTKPRVVAMVTLTTLAGFLMAWPGPLGLAGTLLLLRALAGTALVAAGTLSLNQYLERDVDAEMNRTARRPIPDGRMQPIEALLFGGALTVTGLLLLSLTVNPVSGFVTSLTVIFYLFAYTPLKRRSALCTVVGAFPGALPPVTGWTAAGGGIGIEALVLFGILFFWQLPHSLAIAQLYREDYGRAGIKLLPTVDPDGGSTGRQTVLNSMALLAVGLLPTVLGMTGWVHFIVALAFGGWILWCGIALALRGTRRGARRLLIATYFYVPVVLLLMPLDRVLSWM